MSSMMTFLGKIVLDQLLLGLIDSESDEVDILIQMCELSLEVGVPSLIPGHVLEGEENSLNPQLKGHGRSEGAFDFVDYVTFHDFPPNDTALGPRR